MDLKNGTKIRFIVILLRFFCASQVPLFVFLLLFTPGTAIERHRD
jgi:hypothetical protein